MTERNAESSGEPNQKPEQAPSGEASKAKPAPRRKRRKWPWILVGNVLLLVVLVALLPTLVSSSIGRSIVVSQVNSRINGKLQIQDWSLGWFSGISVDGLVINDESNRQILQLPHFVTKLGLLSAIRGKYNIGQTRIEGLDVLVSREMDGSLNWAHLAKTSESGQPSSAPKTSEPEKKEPKTKKETKLPDVSGELIVADARITYEDASRQEQPVYLRNGQAHFTIPDINQPVTNSFSADVQIGTQKPGTVIAEGTIAAIENNVVMTTPKQLDQTLKLKGLDVAAVMSMAGSLANADLTGRADGQVVVHLTNGSGTADSLLRVAEVNLTSGRGSVAKPVLKNDTFSFVTNAKYTQSATGKEIHISQLKWGDTSGTFSVQKSTDGEIAAMLPQNGNPTAAGSVALSANLKTLNEIAQAFSSATVTAKDPNGMELQSGLLKGKILLEQAAADQIALSGDLGITQITVGNATSTPLKDQTLTLAFKAQANRDLSNVSPELDASGDIFTAKANAQLDLAGKQQGASPVEMLKHLTVNANVPSLVKVQTLLRSFSPPKATPASSGNVAMLHGPAIASAGPLPAGAAPPPAKQPAQEPTTDITGGSATITLNADTNGKYLHLAPKIRLSDLSLKSGEKTYAMSSLNLASDATAVAGTGTEAVREVQIAKTDVDLNDLQVNGKALEEKHLHAGVVGALESGMKVLDVQGLTAQAVTTNAFALNVKGKILDLGSAQRIENAMKVDLSYDADKIVKLLVPLLSPDLQKRLKDAQASGKYQEPFDIRGAFPAGKPFNEAVQQLAMTGRLQVDSFQGAGVDLTKFDMPITLNGGFLRIIYADKPTGQNLPPPAGFNGGTLNLAGSQIDLRGATPTLTTVGNLGLLDNAGLNPVFAAWSLGTVLANPIFVGADKASGYLTIRIVECRDLPLSSALNSGNATIDISIRQLSIVNQLIEKLGDVAHFNKDSIRGDVPHWRSVIQAGIVEQDFTLTVGQNQRPLKLNGKVRLADLQMMPLVIDLPWKLFGIKDVPKGLEKAFPDAFQIPLRGTVDQPQFAFDFNKMLQDSAGKNLGELVPGILGNKDGATTNPSENDPLKSLGDLIDQATKKKKKK
jgi:hypothetical protein